MTDDNQEYIKFDVSKLKALDNVYRESMRFLASHFDFNLNSSKQLKAYIFELTDLTLLDTRINTLDMFCKDQTEGSHKQDMLEIIVAYKRISFSIKNYTTYILNHNVDGKVYLTENNGIFYMPNKQILSYNQEVIGCITRLTPKVLEAINLSSKLTKEKK